MQNHLTFNRVPEKVPEKVWEALVQSQVKLNRVPEKIPEKVPGRLGSGEGSGEGRGGFGAEPGSGEDLGGFAAEPGQVEQGSEKVLVWEALVQSQVRFNRVPEKVPEKVPEIACTAFQLTETKLRCIEAASQHASERLVKIQPFGCWGYHRSLFFPISQLH